MKDKEKTDIILSCLKDYFTSWGRERTNILFPELRLGSGYCGVAKRRMDLFIISSNAGNETIGFEIKASRQDFKKDVSNELKQRGARLYCNKFYYVAPKNMLKIEEIPLWAGLWEIDVENEKDVKQCRFTEKIPAPLHAKAMPSWGLICSMIRHINKDGGYEENKELKQQISTLQTANEQMKMLLTRVAHSIPKNTDDPIWWSLTKYM